MDKPLYEKPVHPKVPPLCRALKVLTLLGKAVIFQDVTGNGARVLLVLAKHHKVRPLGVLTSVPGATRVSHLQVQPALSSLSVRSNQSIIPQGPDDISTHKPQPSTSCSTTQESHTPWSRQHDPPAYRLWNHSLRHQTQLHRCGDLDFWTAF